MFKTTLLKSFQIAIILGSCFLGGSLKANTFTPERLIEESFFDETTAKAKYRHPHPMAVHWCTGGSANNELIEIENGSVWKVSPFDTNKTRAWCAGDPIVITQNSSWLWFSEFAFVFHNMRTYQSVEVNITAPPHSDSTKNHWIQTIDLLSGIIELENAKFWGIHSSDLSKVQAWEEDDWIMVGMNDGWSSLKHPEILINARTRDFIRVRDM